MKFSLIINATEPWLKSQEHALSLVQTMANEGHEIGAVFFYGQSVQIVNHRESIQQWQQWKQHSPGHNSCKLMLCSTMLERYDLLSKASNVAGFEPVGMASWVQAMEAADRTLELV